MPITIQNWWIAVLAGGFLVFFGGVDANKSMALADPLLAEETRNTEFPDKSKFTQRQNPEKVNANLPVFSNSAEGGGRTPLFVLREVHIEGVQIFEKKELEYAYLDLIGKNVSEADLLSILETLTDHYQEQGYLLTRAILPTQDIVEGRVRVQVLEGAIDEVIISGLDSTSTAIKNLIQSFKNKHPLTLSKLERFLLLLNDIPGVKVKDTALDEIEFASGRFRLAIHAEVHRFETYLRFDNRGTPEVGRVRGYSTTAVNSALAFGDEFELDLSTIPETPKERRYGRLTYKWLVGGDGATIKLRGSYSEVWPDDYRRLTDTHYQTEKFIVEGTLVPLRSRQKSLWITASFMVRNATKQSQSVVLYDDKIRTAGLLVEYHHHDDRGGSNYLNLGTRIGLDLWDSSKQGSTELSNDDGSGEFAKAYFSFIRYQELTNNWSLRLSAEGQIASRALLSSEEFTFGGSYYGRAYDSGEIEGEDGIAASTELRFDQDLDHPYLDHYQLYAFVDTGTIWNRSVGQNERYSLSSAGAGIRFSLKNDYWAEFEAAIPFDFESTDYEEDEARLYFSISKSFKSCSFNELICTR